MRRTTPEGAVLRAVTDLLTAERIWWMRTNTGTQVLEDTHGKKRVFRAGRSGMADILALPTWPSCSGPAPCGGTRTRIDGDGCCPACGADAIPQLNVVWIECKSPTGKQSAAQKEFQTEVEAEGHTYLLVRDVSEAVKWLRGSR